MYNLVAIRGVELGQGKSWKQFIDSDYSVKRLNEELRACELELRIPTSTQSLYLNLFDISARWGTFSGTVSSMLSLLENEALPVKTTGLKYNHQTCVYRDALSAGYSIKPVNPANVYDPRQEPFERTNLLLTRNLVETDYAYLQKRVLMSINGFYHLCDTDGVSGLTMINAMRSIELTGQCQIGMVSFSSIADIHYVPITGSRVIENRIGRVSLSTGQDLTNKSVFLVFAGYLLFLDGQTFTRTGDDRFTIDMTNLGLIDRYFEASRFIDLSSINTLKDALTPGRVDVDSLSSVGNNLAWLSLSQTFLVVVDTPQLYTQKQYLSASTIVGTYYSYTQPSLPLCMESGRQPAYASIKEGRQWKILVQDNLVEQKLYHEINTANWQNSDDPLHSGKPYRISRAHFLEIGKDIDA
jgi:hypothetical protein